MDSLPSILEHCNKCGAYYYDVSRQHICPCTPNYLDIIFHKGGDSKNIKAMGITLGPCIVKQTSDGE